MSLPHRALRPMARTLALAAALLPLVLDARLALAHSEPVTARVFVQPAQPVPGEEVEIRVLLNGARSGYPVLGAEVSIIADMPMHAMTPVTASLFRGQERNEHVGSLRFTMAGSWEVTVDVRHQGERDSATFGTEVKMPATARDEGVARHTLTLAFPAGRSNYSGRVLVGSVLLMALIVELAWINKHVWKLGQRRGRRTRRPARSRSEP